MGKLIEGILPEGADAPTRAMVTGNDGQETPIAQSGVADVSVKVFNASDRSTPIFEDASLGATVVFTSIQPWSKNAIGHNFLHILTAENLSSVKGGMTIEVEYEIDTNGQIPDYGMVPVNAKYYVQPRSSS